jgi:chromosome segregation ATPase
MLLHGVHTKCGCSGAVEHGHRGGLCIALTCSWRVANFGSYHIGAQVDAACIIRDKQLERSASVTRQLSKTISTLQDYRTDSEINLSTLRQTNAELNLQKGSLQKANTALEHKLQQLQQRLINKTAEATRLTEDCTAHVSARQELDDQLRDRARRIRTLEGESKAITEFAGAL